MALPYCAYRQSSCRQALRLTPRARFLARVAVGADPVMQLTGVIPAAQRRSTALV